MYRITTDHAFLERVDKTRAESLTHSLQPALTALATGKNAAANPILTIAKRQDDLATINALASDIRSRFAHVVVVGAGGSSLSGRALAALKSAARPSLHFLENIDPDAIDDLLARVELAKTLFIVISKSGSTVETLGHFYVLLEAAGRAVGTKNASRHFLVITMPGDNVLRQSAAANGITVLDHAPDIGGRFSMFTNVGLLPAAIAGFDIAAFRKGAATLVHALHETSAPAAFAPALGAALNYAWLAEGRNINVMLAYSERLSGFTSWYRQSWAESLGKSGKGSTPAIAIGTTDQHSQLQLYLDGPRDKFFTVITARRANTGHALTLPADERISYLTGKTTGDIIAAEQKATLETLIKGRCPLRHIQLDALNESSLGALFMHFTLEIACMGALLNINPFDQPAVEEGKQLAREYLRTSHL